MHRGVRRKQWFRAQRKSLKNLGNAIRRWAFWSFVLGAVLPSALTRAEPPSNDPHWVGIWASAPLVPSTIIENEQLTISKSGTTMREVVHLTLGGHTLRIRFTNQFGTSPLRIGAAQIAETLSGASIRPGTIHPITFNQQSSVLIPPGTLVLSDPIAMTVKALSVVSVTIYIPELPGTLTEHQLASATSYQIMGNKVNDLTLTSHV